ncbi:uncharacterized protein LOC112512126 [Cynara cardunculus var. scolymus]|uniref:Uncharacterized protein n=1 Tax=Cynara cardunculus var. scolymus TaxID=59895 RepID=A0A103Y6X8_CYNCS|nr:uncharacterized protein LOC112512126 [Cynara cardunculus var. scolymus]KVI03637.1 hypothetical protein Ccrd_018062 [Cynara cardunculus var. scolymus]
MENKNQSTSFSPPPPPHRSSSSSSFTAELFGDNNSQPSSTGVFASIFPPPSMVLARNPNCSQFTGATQKETSESQVWTTTHVTSAENVAKNTASANSSIMNMERRSIFQERVEPSPLSSSLYYGGQEDMYVCSSSDPTSQSYPKFKKMEGKDDPNHLHSASRGNWWQGSLYY